MKINLVYNKSILGYEDSLEKIEGILLDKSIEFQTFELNNMCDFGEFTFVLGGDGTLIRAAKYYSEYKIPVMGLNIGRLGFLAQSDSSLFDEIVSDVLRGEYYTEERLMLESERLIALNDFVIKGSSVSRTSKFLLKINDKIVCEYVADGLIISTPTGSTAYGLSAGGPVLSPKLDAIAIIPICPHTLNARPLVIPSDERLEIESCDSLLTVAVDGYNTLESLKKIQIISGRKKANLAFLNNTDFYSVLREKLHWGISPCK